MASTQDTKLLDALRAGASFDAACKAVKIKVQELKKRLSDDPEFALDAACAVADAEIGYLETLRKAAEKGDWRAAAWWLERRGEGFSKSKDDTDASKVGKLSLVVKKVGRRSTKKQKRKS